MGAGGSAAKSPGTAALPTLKLKKYEEVLTGKQEAVRGLFYSLELSDKGVLSLESLGKVLAEMGIPKADEAGLKAWYDSLEEKPEGGLDECAFGYYLAEVALSCDGDDAPAAKFDKLIEKASAFKSSKAVKGQLNIHPLSQPSRSCMWLASYLKLGVKTKSVDLLMGAHKTPEYLAKFPAGAVPTFEDGDFYLEESAAILNYLAAGSSLVPKCPKKQAAVDFAMFKHGENARQVAAKVLRHLIFTKDPKEREEGIKAGNEAIAPILAKINDTVGKTKYLLGDEITLIDFLTVPELDTYAFVGPKIGDPLQKYEGILAYLERMKAEPGYAATHKAMADFLTAASGGK